MEMDVKIDLSSVLDQFEASQKENKELKQENTELKEQLEEVKAAADADAEEDIYDAYHNFNPRDRVDNFCHLSLEHCKYNLGDKEPTINYNNYDSWEEIEQMLIDDYDAHILVTVSMTDHSYLSIYAGEPRDPWDAGKIGFAWVTKEEIKKRFGDDSEASMEKARQAIHAEIEEYAAYVS